MIFFKNAGQAVVFFRHLTALGPDWVYLADENVAWFFGPLWISFDVLSSISFSWLPPNKFLFMLRIIGIMVWKTRIGYLCFRSKARDLATRFSSL
jgi:hypothetical protein